MTGPLSLDGVPSYRFLVAFLAGRFLAVAFLAGAFFVAFLAAFLGAAFFVLLFVAICPPYRRTNLQSIRTLICTHYSTVCYLYSL